MDILINELSLNGQFSSKDKFLENVQDLLPIFKTIEKLNFKLLKKTTLFSLSITSTLNFNDILQSKDDKVRRIKSSLLKLSHNPPYWDEVSTQKHTCIDNYTYMSSNVCNSSLAESCERDESVVSFSHTNFTDRKLEVLKNGSLIEIINITKMTEFIEDLFNKGYINALVYAELIFKNTNLNFSLLETDYGFDILNDVQKKEFLNSFFYFKSMSWEEISASDGLEYKKYNKPKKRRIKGWFRDGTYKDTDIYKFRTTQEYRCFGFRKGDIFYPLRFEIDHSISDNG